MHILIWKQKGTVDNLDLQTEDCGQDEKFMKEAIKQAKKAEAIDEVPIGCVIVHEGKIIARGYNKRNTMKTTLAHAELLAIRKACKKLGDWRVENCTMYITLEPCQMCAHFRALSDVCRGYCAGKNSQSSDWCHE